MTARISPDLLVAFPDKPDAKALPHTVHLNQKVAKHISNELHAAVKIGTTQNLIPKVQNLVQSYFNQPGAVVRGNAYSILNASNAAPASAASISYWNDQSKAANSQIDNTKKAVQKLDQHLQEIQKLKLSIKGKANTGFSQVMSEEKNKLKKTVRKTEKIIKKLEKKEKAIQRLINSPNVQDAGVRNSLTSSLNQVSQYKSSLNEVKSGLKKDLIPMRHIKPSHAQVSHTAHISGPANAHLTVPSSHSTHSANKNHRRHH